MITQRKLISCVHTKYFTPDHIRLKLKLTQKAPYRNCTSLLLLCTTLPHDNIDNGQKGKLPNNFILPCDTGHSTRTDAWETWSNGSCHVTLQSRITFEEISKNWYEFHIRFVMSTIFFASVETPTTCLRRILARFC